MTRVVVIEPPEPIVMPADISGDHAADDAGVASMIQAATEDIDGPSGWVGRCFGVQTLEASFEGFPVYGSVVLPLPYPPLIDIVSVSYLNGAGVEQAIDRAFYGTLGSRGLYPRPGYTWPTTLCVPDAVRVRYRAGYDGETTGKVPERARQAIILGVRNLQAVGAENLFLRSEEVEGVGSRSFTVSDVAGRVLRETAERLLSTLRVFA